MLWQKSWWETRWIFLTILGTMLLLLLVASIPPWEQPDLTRWAAWVQMTAQMQQDGSGWGEKKRFLTLLSGWPGYVWWKWFNGLMVSWPLYAMAMTVALSRSSCPRIGAPGAAIRFTFSLPVSRRKALLTQAAFVAIEMSGETYFRYGQIPWLGLLASLAVSALMMFAAARIYERRDF